MALLQMKETIPVSKKMISFLDSFRSSLFPFYENEHRQLVVRIRARS